jgi:hypothetical protein
LKFKKKLATLVTIEGDTVLILKPLKKQSKLSDWELEKQKIEY